MSKLAQTFKKGKKDPYFILCPECGVQLPRNLKGCWNCGEVLDPVLIEQAEVDKE